VWIYELDLQSAKRRKYCNHKNTPVMHQTSLNKIPFSSCKNITNANVALKRDQCHLPIPIDLQAHASYQQQERTNYPGLPRPSSTINLYVNGEAFDATRQGGILISRRAQGDAPQRKKPAVQSKCQWAYNDSGPFIYVTCTVPGSRRMRIV
jgi:hypothetical protein